MPTSGWTRFTIAVFVGLSFFLSLAAAAVGLEDRGQLAYLGAAASGAVLVLLAIDRWAWRWPLVRKALRVPDLEGTWEIELKSGYKGDGGGAKTSYLVIHQTYSAITVEVLTDLGRSYSETASLARRGSRLVLSYVYRAEPEAIRRAGNEPHRGAAELVVSTEPTLHFEGDYWTDRETVGRLRSVGWNPSKCGSHAAAREASFTPHS